MKLRIGSLLNSSYWIIKVENFYFYSIIAFLSEPPSINEDDVSRQNLTVIAGRSKVIDCPARGVPAPEIIWLKVCHIHVWKLFQICL